MELILIIAELVSDDRNKKHGCIFVILQMFFCFCYSLISQIPNENPQDSFLKVAREIFADGQFNWGRVVMLFYFAYKMAIRVRWLNRI